jgi:hypothetical protein
MLTPNQNRAVVRVSAAYDLATVLGFVTPWTLGPTLALILGVGRPLGLHTAIPHFDPTQMLFANLMGSAVLVWSLARLKFPTQALGRFDALSRALFAVWEIWAVLQGASPVILAFTVAEIAFGVAEMLPVNARDGVTRREMGLRPAASPASSV